MRRVDPEGQPSITHYRVLEQFKDHTLLALRLETGRTHQIRVHMSYLDHPLAGDDLYGGSMDRIGRHCLHCHKVWFTLNGKEISIESKLPADMATLAETLRNENI